jgi:hypothetical protein
LHNNSKLEPIDQFDAICQPKMLSVTNYGTHRPVVDRYDDIGSSPNDDATTTATTIANGGILVGETAVGPEN